MANKPMDVKELAEFLRLTPNHVREMANAGRIPSDCIIRPPGCLKYRFIREKIEQWAVGNPPGPRRRPARRR